jgi:hypothetical protein
MTGGGDAVAMEVAILNGGQFADAGVADTPANRALWTEIKDAIAALPAGVTADVPADWTTGG